LADSPEIRLNAALVGRYRIARELGKGGMATVYLAQDLRHNRLVGLKVLRPELAAVVGADRFLAEIETTAKLQHPHILPLFDSGEAGGFLFYVMPYVEGESLRDRLDRERQLPIDEAVRIATAVAQALDYAHRHGVIHRDIKPPNLLLHDGEPLVSDFGIALAVSAGSAGRLTETGLSLGTPHYMSPEQATGDQAVGPATDIWALGCVLYEMLVGAPPYVGSTPQAILGKIIQAVPASASAARRMVPANVDAAIRKALEKLPADRFSSARALAEAVSDPGFRHGEPEATSLSRSNAWRRLALTGWAVAAGAVSVLAFELARPEPPRPLERFVLPYDPLGAPVLLPDGSGVVIAAPRAEGSAQLWLRTWDDLEPRPIAGTEGVQGGTGAVSPDGRELAFTSGGQLKVVSLGGGSARTLTEGSACCEWWAADGYVYFQGAARNILRVRGVGGAVEEVTTSQVQRAHSHYRVVPDEDVAVFEDAAGPGTDSRIVATRPSTGERKEIAFGSRPFLTATKHLVWVTEQGALMGAPFDLERADLTSEPVALLGAGSVGLRSRYSVSASGTLAYVRGGNRPLHELVWVDRSGAATPVDAQWSFDAGGGSAGWRLSPDGTRIAVREQTAEGSGIWIKDLRSGSRTRLTFAEDLHRMPRWAPDGRTVTYLTGSGGDLNVWSRRADGAGEASLVFDHALGLAEGFYSPGGEWLLVRVGSGSDGGLRDILTVRPGVDTAAAPLLASPEFAEQSPAVSPDGRWIAYASDETGRLEVYVRPFPHVDGEKLSVSRSGGGNPIWSRDGRRLFFVNDQARQLMVARVSTSDGFSVDGAESVLEIPPSYYLDNLSDFYDVAPDGERFLFARRVESSAGGSLEIVLVRNWIEELIERVPVSR
jgi:serine/threonine-protein kinase